MKMQNMFKLLCLVFLSLTGLIVSVHAEDEAPAAEQLEPPQISIPLQKHLRMVIRPTILGLVPPDDPAHFGEVFVRITEAGSGSRIRARYEIKESGVWVEPVESDKPVGITRSPKPTTRFRRGELTATGLLEANTVLPPLIWADGDFSSSTGVLWLSEQTFIDLRSDGSAAWDPTYDNEGFTADMLEWNQNVSTKAGEVRDPQTLILLPGKTAYPVEVNGRRVRLDAVTATDSLGVATYVVLNDPDNPLVLKLTFAGETGGQQLNNSGDNLISSGAGYAVVSLDF